ncbi:MAG: CCA tRNA nucleotidyltransferase [Rhodobacteraceae bacterium]|nr:CCA tRNA nucleotidyltransferase [Paracoccaceae bacterium]
MRIGGDWLRDPGLQGVLGMLEAAGHRAWLVGGCVRDALMGMPVGDIDIATDARPEQVAALAGAAGFRAVPTGIGHGTVTVVAGGVPHEVTTLRRDVRTDGRRAVVAFTTELAEDAARRDFTMNALYADRAGAVSDPLGGLGDVLARRVRFVGDPHARIREDYLRILRFFRFHAACGDPAGGLDADGLAACAELAGGLTRISRERIGHEMRRLLAAPDPAPAVAAMQAAGVLARVLPGAGAQALAPLVRLEAGRPAGWIARLAALGGAGAAERLRLSTAEARQLALLLDAAGSDRAPGEIAFRHGAGTARAVALLRAALAGADLPPGLEAEIARGAAAVLPVRAEDLMPGLQGPALGRRLREIEARWIASGFALSREQLLA